MLILLIISIIFMLIKIKIILNSLLIINILKTNYFYTLFLTTILII